MTDVKADSKGRVTGASPEETYNKITAPDGTLVYKPTTPRDFDEVRTVSHQEFENFFGAIPEAVPSGDGVEIHPISPEYRTGVLPYGIVVSHFPVDSEGNRILGQERLRTLIRIC